MSESNGTVGRYVRERETWTAAEWAIPVVALVVCTVNLYAGTITGDGAYTVIGVSFLAGAALYLSVYWQPVLYLIVVLYLLTLGAFWLFAGLPLFGLGVVNGALSLGLVVLCVYLYVQYAETGDEE